ncbi:MAG: alkaline phosphatase [Proteobacteria bacterium]|nr:alkaline phosphatase [Pseudomonadota bacterium]
MKRKHLAPRLSLLLILAAMLASCNTYNYEIKPNGYVPPEKMSKFELETKDKKVKNVVFMIGDGMGINHIFITRKYAVGMDKKLHLERMPYTGIVTTYPVGEVMTDSAAAGTALASGMKTTNGTIGQLPDGTKIKTIMEVAEDRGMATGLIATKEITDATPAAYAAHNASRSNQAEIAVDILDNNIDLILGGGRKYWLPEELGGKREDNRNLIQEAKDKGYVYLETKADFEKVERTPVLGLFREGWLETNEEEPSLREMTKRALQLLNKDKDGFFIMVEASQIDTQSHAHDEEGFMDRVLKFDMAVKEAIEFAKKDGHTLVVVTSDHETGGLMPLMGGLQWSAPIISLHSASPVAVFAYGPGAENFTGVFENTDLPKIVAQLLDFKDFPGAQ